MASDNIKTLTRIYDAWGRGDFTAGVDALEQNVTLVVDPEIPDAGVFVGADGTRSYMTRFLGSWETLTIAAESFREVGDTILVEITQTGTGKSSGAPAELGYFQLWTFRGGKIIRIETIVDEPKAHEAIGLAGTG